MVKISEKIEKISNKIGKNRKFHIVIDTASAPSGIEKVQNKQISVDYL